MGGGFRPKSSCNDVIPGIWMAVVAVNIPVIVVSLKLADILIEVCLNFVCFEGSAAECLKLKIRDCQVLVDIIIWRKLD